MDSEQYHDDDDDNELVFQNLMPEKPANAFQKRIIHLQDNWPPHWNKRHLFLLLTVLSSLLIIFLVFELMHPSTQPDGTHNLIASDTTNVAQINNFIPYDNAIYVLLAHKSSNYDQLEALNTKTGTRVWNYPQQNVEGLRLFGNILYVQTNTSLNALNANTRASLWEDPIFSDANTWQIDQGILFTTSTNGTVTALNASTGTKIWQTQQPSLFWQVDNGIFYMTPASGLGLSALNAHNGQQLWSDMSFDPGTTINDSISNQDLILNNDDIYLQNNANQNIQAFDGRNDTMLWQFNTHGKDFTLSTQNGFLLLSDTKQTQVEVLNGQTGKLLWQRQGTLNALTNENPNQIAISSLQNDEINIVSTSEGTTLYHIPRIDNPLEDSPHIKTLFSIANGIVFFIYFTQQYSVQYADPKVVAVRIDNGVTIWNSETFNNTPALHDDTIDIVINHNSLLSLRADNGHTLWQHTFNTTGN